MPLDILLLKKIRRLQIISTQLANDVLAGAYKSAFKGSGIEFEEVRDYLPGDEMRAIDWNVTARLGKPFVKSFKEERSITVMLVVDISASTQYGTKNALKKEVIAEIASLLAFSAIKNGDKVGLILFSDTIEKYIPANNTVTHVLRIVRELLLFENSHTLTDFNVALSFFAKVQRKKSVCFLISDFLAAPLPKVAALVSKQHDMIALAVSDPSEKVLFPNSALTVMDLETLQQSELIITDEMQDSFFKEGVQRLELHKKHLYKYGIDFLDIPNNKPYVSLLRSFFKNRRRQ